MTFNWLNELLSISLFSLAVLLADFYWIARDSPYRYFGLIGFALFGYFWNSEHLPRWKKQAGRK